MQFTTNNREYDRLSDAAGMAREASLEARHNLSIATDESQVISLWREWQDRLKASREAQAALRAFLSTKPDIEHRVTF